LRSEVVVSLIGNTPRVVTVLCDRAERYFSTRLFSGAASPVPEPSA
jgi:hypothetical protein